MASGLGFVVAGRSRKADKPGSEEGSVARLVDDARPVGAAEGCSPEPAETMWDEG